MTGKLRPELTDGQKDCLRLVDDHHTSKEIARILGISPFTVDQRLDGARRKLKAASRKEAAKIFTEIEQATIYDRLVYEPSQVEADANLATSQISPNQAGQILSRLASILSVPPIGGERHELSKKQIVLQSLNIAFFSTLVVTAIIIVLAGAMRLFR
jgi:DNA-binding CsgD family transcriptional regulator